MLFDLMPYVVGSYVALGTLILLVSPALLRKGTEAGDLDHSVQKPTHPTPHLTHAQGCNGLDLQLKSLFPLPIQHPRSTRKLHQIQHGCLYSWFPGTGQLCMQITNNYMSTEGFVGISNDYIARARTEIRRTLQWTCASSLQTLCKGR